MKLKFPDSSPAFCQFMLANFNNCFITSMEARKATVQFSNGMIVNHWAGKGTIALQGRFTPLEASEFERDYLNALQNYQTLTLQRKL